MAKPSYGVIVGRFQVNNLTPGHLDLFQKVSEQHERVIVFIGVSPTGITRRNPLDFETRKKMIQADYPDFIFVPITDTKYDEPWSKTLDEKIADIVAYGDVTLYGGRDSFLPHYKGKHKVHELLLKQSISGSEVREQLTNRVMQDPAFRAGVIYAAMNMYPRCVTTVDAALWHRNPNGKISVCLGRKEGERGWRFVGGHAVPGKSFEENVRKETTEETRGLEIIDLQYIGSYPINDWRWAKEIPDGVVTAFFSCETMTRGGQGDDDLEEIRWFDFDDMTDGFNIEGVHRTLLTEFVKFMEKKNAITQTV